MFIDSLVVPVFMISCMKRTVFIPRCFRGFWILKEVYVVDPFVGLRAQNVYRQVFLQHLFFRNHRQFAGVFFVFVFAQNSPQSLLVAFRLSLSCYNTK